MTLQRKKYARLGLGALGAWAAGGNEAAGRGTVRADEEGRERALAMHREAVLWYLRSKLQEAGRLQGDMMETRLRREVERSRSVLYLARGQAVPAGPDQGAFESSMKGTKIMPPQYDASRVAQMQRSEQVQSTGAGNADDMELTQAQIQQFEQQNQDMLRHYEATLNQVRSAESSLLEISSLQTQLVDNLATQSAHIDQLVADSFATTENVGGGHRELKRATERKSTARAVFWGVVSLCSGLVIWDLIF